MEMTSNERLMRIFQNREIDRPALKLWGASAGGHCIHPDYKPVSRLAAQTSDLFGGGGSPFDIYYGKNRDGNVESFTKPTGDSAWEDVHTVYRTPEGDLHGIDRVSTVGEPSYVMEHPVKEPADLKKLLSINYEPFPFKPGDFFKNQRKLGGRGVVMFGLDNAAYALHRMAGSENLAYFSVDCREELEEVIAVYAGRILSHLRSALEAGIRGPFCWVGPELFIPPLLSPRDFDDFVYRYDKPLCDEIHNAGGYVWVHCHGKVANFIERFINMGVDILNPLEPPKNGDVNLKTCVEQFGNRIGWEGNIEIQDILQAQPDKLKELIAACVEEGNKSGRFILCPSAGYMEYPRPSKQYIDNLMLYLSFGLECAENCRK